MMALIVLVVLATLMALYGVVPGSLGQLCFVLIIMAITMLVPWVIRDHVPLRWMSERRAMRIGLRSQDLGARNDARAILWLKVSAFWIAVTLFIAGQWFFFGEDPIGCIWREDWNYLPAALKSITRVCPDNLPLGSWFSGWTVFILGACVFLFVFASLIYAAWSQWDEVRRKLDLWDEHRRQLRTANGGQAPAPPAELAGHIAGKTFMASALVAILGDVIVDNLLRGRV